MKFMQGMTLLTVRALVLGLKPSCSPSEACNQTDTHVFLIYFCIDKISKSNSFLFYFILLLV